MEKLIIHGGHSLRGTVRVSSAKNAILPIIVATLLPVTPATIVDAPHLDDVSTICSVLESLGVKVTHGEGRITFDAVEVNKTEASYELMSRMRASFLVMGPLLAKMGHARIALPGGCMIGSRPIDLHLKAFEAMGAEIHVGNGYVEGWAPGGLKGNTIYLDFPSVGATENILMAAVTAKGRTIIENAAEEPEIVDLVTFLNGMGANIKGAGTNVIRIEGVKELYGVDHTVIPDRIEAGTFMIAAAMVGGDVMPFVGEIHDRPSVLEGTCEEMILQAREYLAKGVYGIDLLGYRYTGDAARLNEEFVRAVDAPVCIAGSINGYQRLNEIRKATPWAFTIGSAFFENKFDGNFGEQINKVCQYIKREKIT